MSILQKISWLLVGVSLFFVTLSPFAFADILNGGQGAQGQADGGQGAQGQADGGQGSTQKVERVTLNNPLRVNSIEELLVAILNIFMVLMIPIIVFFIILAGFKYVTAQGNPGQIEEATTTFTYAIIGGVLILAAVAIAEIIKNTVDSFAA